MVLQSWSNLSKSTQNFHLTELALDGTSRKGLPPDDKGYWEDPSIIDYLLAMYLLMTNKVSKRSFLGVGGDCHVYLRSITKEEFEKTRFIHSVYASQSYHYFHRAPGCKTWSEMPPGQRPWNRIPHKTPKHMYRSDSEHRIAGFRSGRSTLAGATSENLNWLTSAND